MICGAISQYNSEFSQEGARGPSMYLRLAERHSKMEGYAVNHFMEKFGEAEAQIADWLK